MAARPESERRRASNANTNDYTLSGGAITFKSASMSSSNASWQTKALVFSESAGHDINGDGDTNDTVWANGEGLKNALAAYNHGLTGGTQGFVTSQDGTQIGWEDSIATTDGGRSTSGIGAWKSCASTELGTSETDTPN